jgi:DNA-binding LytR/AlgR family response regulator
MELKCAIIDDEPLARECIVNYVEQVDFLHLVGVGSNALELNKMRETTDIDLVFLDIQMPFMNGIEYLKTAKDAPMIILTTAYPSYALESYQLDVMDYLLKPITFNRFFMAITKAKDYHCLLSKSQATPVNEAPEGGYFFIKSGYRFERVYFRDVLFIEALQNYVTIYTSKGKFMTLLTLKNVEDKLDPGSFIRVHKSFIVSVSKIEGIENNEICIQTFRVPISRQYRESVMGKVVSDKLWKK